LLNAKQPALPADKSNMKVSQLFLWLLVPASVVIVSRRS